jgi:hypothetical protein
MPQRQSQSPVQNVQNSGYTQQQMNQMMQQYPNQMYNPYQQMQQLQQMQQMGMYNPYNPYGQYMQNPYNPYTVNPYNNPYQQQQQMNPMMNSMGMNQMQMGGGNMGGGNNMGMNGMLYKMIQKQVQFGFQFVKNFQMNATEMLLEQHEVENKNMQQQLVSLISHQQAKVEPKSGTPKSAISSSHVPTPMPPPPESTHITDEILNEDEEVRKLKIRHTLEMMQLQFEKDKLQRQQELINYRETLDKYVRNFILLIVDKNWSNNKKNKRKYTKKR